MTSATAPVLVTVPSSLDYCNSSSQSPSLTPSVHSSHSRQQKDFLKMEIGPCCNPVQNSEDIWDEMEKKFPNRASKAHGVGPLPSPKPISSFFPFHLPHMIDTLCALNFLNTQSPFLLQGKAHMVFLLLGKFSPPFPLSACSLSRL